MGNRVLFLLLWMCFSTPEACHSQKRPFEGEKETVLKENLQNCPYFTEDHKRDDKSAFPLLLFRHEAGELGDCHGQLNKNGLAKWPTDQAVFLYGGGPT